MVAVIRHKHEKIRSGYQQSSGSNRGRERDRQSACAQETAACTAPQCLGRGHLLAEPSHFTDPDAAARKLVQIANASEAVQDGRIYIELIDRPFLKEGGTPDQYRAALARAVTLGWLWLHESGSYVKFTPAGAELLA
jgi:hypothetical protein